ncbi:uncharacterized protein F4822DRAFT_444296 [Hypoxylon trugodes]|uniref:uncharacterized protein n=1 Tax=Hypoxylon trugodes TaxID=326681 RepID=UPI002198D5D7|nr:uncharacterized protein F4822DRAFT_444296 [Hypoxylon trugodes]KAI1387696.1 hypothetical protein F4822DRAFT_444296 [Hypoxylon trugodes]
MEKNLAYSRAREKRDTFLSITDSVPVSVSSNFVVCILFSSIALFFVILRILARIRTRAKFAFNDYAIFWAMFWSLFLAIDSIVTASYGGVGHHIEEIMALAPQILQPMLKTVLIGQFTWALANTGVKLSMIDLYIKLFGTNKRFQSVSYILMSAVGLYCLMVILIAFLLCRPLAFNWDTSIPGGHCGNRNSAFLASGVMNLVLDVAVLILPLPMLWNLNMAMNKKISLMLMFSIGVGICGFTIWRMVIIYNMNEQDFFYEDGILSTMSNLEPLLGICVACLLVCRPLLIAFGQKIRVVASSAMSRVGGTISDSHGVNISTRSENMAGRSIHSAGRRKFKRLHDTLYPMSDLTGTTECEGPPDSNLERGRGSEWNNGIKVTETWEVASERHP